MAGAEHGGGLFVDELPVEGHVARRVLPVAQHDLSTRRERSLAAPKSRDQLEGERKYPTSESSTRSKGPDGRSVGAMPCSTVARGARARAAVTARWLVSKATTSSHRSSRAFVSLPSAQPISSARPWRRHPSRPSTRARRRSS